MTELPSYPPSARASDGHQALVDHLTAFIRGPPANHPLDITRRRGRSGCFSERSSMTPLPADVSTMRSDERYARGKRAE
jgi:hypothetical protein